MFREELLRDGRGFDVHNVAGEVVLRRLQEGAGNSSTSPLRECCHFSAIAVPINTEAKRKAVAAATTAEELWKALGVDAWAVVPIASVSRPGHDLEGTRLTVSTLPATPTASRKPSASLHVHTSYQGAL